MPQHIHQEDRLRSSASFFSSIASLVLARRRKKSLKSWKFHPANRIKADLCNRDALPTVGLEQDQEVWVSLLTVTDT
jgi:hypothetical protein